MGEILGSHDILLLTLDTLRFDVARDAMAAGETPAFARLFPGGWEERHAPASFTYASHRAFFAGFLPTPARPGRHDRLFALDFPGSETTGPGTAVLPGADIVGGLATLGYRTICVGGVGFFNPATTLGADLTELFQEAHWRPSFGVSEPCGFEHQISHLAGFLADGDRRPRFVFVNVSSLHQPNLAHLPGATHDTISSHRAALRYVDAHVPALLRIVTAERPCLVIACSDHGTAYGEDGYQGHRIGHPVVWTVPYAEATVDRGWPP